MCYYENTLYLIIIFHQFTINVHSTIIDLYVFSLPDTCHPFSIQVYISVLINSGSGLTKLLIGILNYPIQTGYLPTIEEW